MTPADIHIPDILTKRTILSQANSIYDPLGLAGLYTVRAKILMRKLWTNETQLDWDDPIPEENRREWVIFFNDLPEMEKVTVKRCMKPNNAVGDPVLVIFSDGSNNAYGASAYVRWELSTGEFDSYLILSKNRLAPVKRMSIDRIELCGAVLNKRLKTILQQQCRYTFKRRYHIVDSQIVHAMIHKESFGFNTFAATRVGEIQEGIEKNNWYWIESKHNIADWLTRGRRPNEIDDKVMTFSELQTVCFEAANLVNERPIGRHPTLPDDESYLCPNDLLLGRYTSRVPSGRGR